MALCRGGITSCVPVDGGVTGCGPVLEDITSCDPYQKRLVLERKVPEAAEPILERRYEVAESV